MFVLLLIILVINETFGSRKDDTIRYDILIINITNAISDHFLTRCLTVIVSSNYTSIENSRNFRIAKLLSMDYEFSKSVVVKTFSGYRDHIKFKYNKNRCARVLNIVLGYDEVVRRELENFPSQEQMQGPVWLFFLNWKTEAVDYFRDINITFDINLIAAKNKDEMVYLEEVYRVSLRHPVRSHDFGNWTPEDGLKAPDYTSLYSRRYDLEGIVLIGGFYDQDGTLNHLNASQVKQIGGYFGKVWKHLEETLNFSTKFTLSPDNLYGGINSQGNWTGLVGMAVRKELDVVVSELTITKERMEVVDFLRPIFMTTLQIFFRAPGILTDWDVVLRPFHVKTWIAFVSAVIIFAVSLKIVQRYNFERKGLGESEFQFLQSLFFVISAITQQGNSLIPGSYSCRIIIFTMYFLSIILLAAYSGALTSFITVEKPQKPFDSLQTMLKDGTYTLEQIPESLGFNYFSNSTDEIVQAIYRKLMSKLSPDQLPKTATEVFERICKKKKKVAHLGEYGMYELAAREFIERKNCQILVMDKPVGKVQMSFIVPKDSPYKGVLDYELTRMKYLGILKKFHSDTWGIRKDPGQTTNKFHVVNGEQVSKIYFFLLMGHMVAVFLVAAEIFHKKNQMLKRKRKILR